jgi:anti-sigma factor RsiW
MAYADGLLGPAERANVEASLREHPDNQRKVEQFRATLKPIRQAFEEQDRDHLAALAARIRQAPATASTGRTPRERVAPRHAQSSPVAAYALRPMALAASLALLVGGGLGWFMHSPPERDQTASADLITFDDGSLRAEGALAQLLETASSGTALRVRDEQARAWQLTAISSFRSVADVPCRRYELTDDVTGRFAGYACRDANARWLIQAHARLDRKVNTKPVYAPAGGGGSDGGPLDVAIRAHMKGDVLQSAEELGLIKRHWSEDRGK